MNWACDAARVGVGGGGLAFCFCFSWEGGGRGGGGLEIRSSSLGSTQIRLIQGFGEVERCYPDPLEIPNRTPYFLNPPTPNI